MHSLTKHPLVDCDLEEAAVWYGQRDPSLADRLIDAAEQAMRQAVSDPYRFPMREGSARRVRLRGFPYVLLYEVSGTTVRAVAIAHGSRDLPSLLKNRVG